MSAASGGSSNAHEVAADLRDFAAELDMTLEEAHRLAATDIAQSAMGKSRARRQSARVTVSAQGAAVVATSGLDIVTGTEFGGGARPRTRQFPPHRGTMGYYLFPSVREYLADPVNEHDRLIGEAVDDFNGGA